MINRREFPGIAAGAGPALALTPERLLAFQESGGMLIQRAFVIGPNGIRQIMLGR